MSILSYNQNNIDMHVNNYKNYKFYPGVTLALKFLFIYFEMINSFLNYLIYRCN